MQGISYDPTQRLYQAQKHAYALDKKYQCQKYKETKSDERTFIDGLYYASYCIEDALQPLVNLVTCVTRPIWKLISYVFRPLVDILIPLDPSTGERVLLPCYIDNLLGRRKYKNDVEEQISQYGGKLDISDTAMKANAVYQRLLASHTCKNLSHYPMTVIDSFRQNASGIHKGGIILHKGYLNTNERALNEDPITQVKIALDDGYVAIVDLKDLTNEDLLASLIGHEASHVHMPLSVTLIISNIAIALIQLIGRFIIEICSLEDHMAYLLLNEVFSDKSYLGSPSYRQQEFNADVFGVHLAATSGYDPRAAILMRAITERKTELRGTLKYHKKYEGLFSHPSDERRMRYCLNAMKVISPDVFAKYVKIEKAASAA